jgi:Fe-S cluster assembly protein SufD
MREPTMTQTTPEWYVSRFRTWEAGMNGAAGTALHALRRTAINAFGELGFPTTRDEEWRFTNVAPIAGTPFVPVLRGGRHRVTRDEVQKHLFAGLKSSHLVFVNGHFAPDLSAVSRMPAGVRVESLAEALERDQNLVLRHLTRYANPAKNAFTSLNTAFVQDGAFIVLPDGVQLEEPIHLLFIASPEVEPFVQNPRNLIVAGNDCRLSIVETYHASGATAYLTNVVSEVIAGERTIIEHDKLQSENSLAYHVGSTHIVQGRGSTVVSNSISLGGAIIRNNVSVHLAGEGSECTLNGLSVSTGEQLIDNHTTIDHAKPNCASHELYKAILDGESRGVFNGKIFVRKDAQKTDAKQTNKTLLLSDDATIDTKPQLEIFADDVKCTHGATVGQLDEDQVFYLRARGIGEEEARDILTFAFATDVVNRIHVEPLRDQLDALLQNRLRQGRVSRQD